MPFQPVTNAYELVLHGQLEGDLDMANVFGIDATIAGALTQSLANAIAAVWTADYLDDIKAYMSTTTIYNSITITDLRTEGAPAFTSTNGFPVAGTDVTGKMPNEVAALTHWTTALRGPSFRGRSYWSGWGIDTSDGNTIKAVPGAALDEMADDIVAAGLYGVISRRHNKALRPAGILTLITGKVTPLEWKSQRGRRPSN